MDSDWEIEYEKEVVSFGNGNLEFNVMSISELPIEFLADLESKQEEISGRRLWPGSLILAHYLTNFPDTIAGKNILELGAGSGICSMLAKRLGASYVVATDGDEECIDLMNQNLQSNGFENDPSIQCFHLQWGDTQSLAAFRETCSSIQTFDVILAGDVLYKRDLLGPFFSTAKELLAEEGQLYLCHLPRAGVGHEMVQETAITKGLNPEIHEGHLQQSGTTWPALVNNEDVVASKLYMLKGI